jgi:hypothetical protein
MSKNVLFAIFCLSLSSSKWLLVLGSEVFTCPSVLRWGAHWCLQFITEGSGQKK